MKGLPPTFLALAGGICLTLSGALCRASADAGGVFTFTWEAPELCPSRERVRLEIARLLGGGIQITQGGDLEARAVVDHGPVWSVALTTHHAGRTGRRSIEAPSCQSVAEATALIIALMIDPDKVAANSQEPEEKPPPTGAPPAVAAPPAGPRSVDFVAGLHAQGSLGTLPGFDVGVGLGIGLCGRRWRMELRGTYGLRRDQVAYPPSLAGAYGRFNITTGALAGCFNLGRPGLAFGPCAFGEAGVVAAEGHGASVGFSKRAPWVALGGGGYVSFAMGRRLRASLEIDVLFPMYRPEYVFQDVPGVVFQAPAAGGRALAGIAWRF